MQSFPAISGDELVLPITVKDNDDVIVNLTGATARFAMARHPGGAIVIDTAASPATASVAIGSPATAGVLTVTITDTTTDALSGDYYYECKVTDVSGQALVVARGYISFAINLI